MKNSTTTFETDSGKILLQLDVSKGDEGIYLFNSDGWLSLDDAEALSKDLISCVKKIRDFKKFNKSEDKP